MGVSVSVDVEGESSVPVKERTDGKPLADIVGGLILVPQAVALLRLSSDATETLRRIDESAYGIRQKTRDAWQNPKLLKVALEETREAFQKIHSNPSLIDELESGPAADYFNREMLDGNDYDFGIEDAISICDWAIKRNKRVRLTAW